MKRRVEPRMIVTLVVVAGLAIVLSGCAEAGTGGGGGGGTTCTATGDYTVAWEFSGSYADGVSVSTTWVKPSGEFSDPSDTKYATIDPSSGSTLLTETLPGCSGATINLVGLDGQGDTKTVTLDATLSIYVDGTLADAVTLTSPIQEGQVVPDGGGLTIVVGE